MPVRKPKQITAFRFNATHPMVVDGIGVLQPGDIVPLDKAKEAFGDDFAGNDVLLPVDDTADLPTAAQPSNGGDD